MQNATYSAGTAAARWHELCAERQSFLDRCEKYAAFTIPKICLPHGYDQQSIELKHDYQSLGAQAVNHLANKLMLALFAPSRPFFRLDPGPKLQKKLSDAQAPDDAIAQQLAKVEADAVRLLDQESLRPKLYEAVKHLPVVGNCLLILERGRKARVLGLKKYAVKRSPDGTMIELLTAEKVAVVALSAAVRAAVGTALPTDEQQYVTLYRWIKRQPGGGYRMTQWVNEVQLPDQPFSGKYTDESLPFYPLTWDLADGDDYGTGLVEDYAGDFAALSMLSEATVQAAILASEFRWLVNPAGQTKPEDFNNSSNGEAIPGSPNDINLVSSAGKTGDLQTNMAVAKRYIDSIGRGFLLGSAVTRDAERVTAEEIRMTAEELESSLGGVYSRIAVDVQVPLAAWLLERSGNSIKGHDIQPTIVTGLAALSRTGDRDNLVLFLQDVGAVGQLPDDVRGRLKLSPILATLAASRGLIASQYTMTDQEAQAQQQANAQQQAAAQAAANQQGQPQQ